MIWYFVIEMIVCFSCLLGYFLMFVWEINIVIFFIEFRNVVVI